MRRFIALLLCLAFVNACAFRMGDLQIVSSKNVQVNPEPVQSAVEGKSCVYWLLGLIPLNGIVPNIEEAMDEAIAAAGDGNILTDVAIYSELFNAIVVAQTCIRVKGDVGNLQ